MQPRLDLQQFRLWFLVLFTVVLAGIAQGRELWPYETELNGDISFWKDIFTKYDKNQVVIHDSENLSLIYKVVTFDSSVDLHHREQQIRQIKDELKDDLLEIAHKTEGGITLSKHDEYLWNLFGETASPVLLRQAAKDIRAQDGMRDKFLEGLSRSLAYLPFIKQVFHDENLPVELAYLPHIESSFNPLAKSRVGASGMWQFMRSTARRYMKVNRIIDQRLDPLVSSRAAARHLKYNFGQTNDWGLAITAYNYGLAGIKRAMRLLSPDYIHIRKTFKNRRFQFASRNFYPEFLAVVQIMDDVEEYFPGIRPAALPDFIKYELKRSVTLPVLAKQLNVKLDLLKELNPEFTYRAWRGWNRVPAGYRVNLPIESKIENFSRYFRAITMDLYLAEQNDTKQEDERPVEELPLQMEVTKINLTDFMPEEFGPVTRQFLKPGVSEGYFPDAALLANYLENSLPGEKEKSESVDAIIEEIETSLKVNNNVVVVYANETLGHFADWLKMPMWRLLKLNKMSGTRRIYQGQKLVVDFNRVSREDFMKKRREYHAGTLRDILQHKQLAHVVDHQISRGDSVWDLAVNQYGVSLELVQYFNSNRDISKIKPGEILKIPVFQSNQSLEETL